jgi:hypothetical protein
MDVIALATHLAASIAPFLPFLVSGGEKAAEAAGEKFGAAAWQQAQALWEKLRPGLERHPVAAEAAREAALAPEDADAHAALRLQLRKLLQQDHELAAELNAGTQQLYAQVQVIVSGRGAVGVVGGVHGGVIQTADAYSRAAPPP